MRRDRRLRRGSRRHRCRSRHIDIAPATDQGNLERLAGALGELRAAIDGGLRRGMTFPRGANRIRRGSPEDVSAVLALFDEAVEWLVARGQTGQWGSTPFSENPRAVDRVRGWACGDGLWIAEKDATAVGTLVLADAPSYAQPAEPDEAYIMLLLSSRQHAGEGIGTQLVDHAVNEAHRSRHSVLRVDCWAGAPGLLTWYERQGFTRTTTFDSDGWVGQILRMPVPASRTGPPRRAV